MGRRATQKAKQRNRRLVTISIVVAIIAVVVVLTLIVEASGNDAGAKYIGLPVSSSVMQALTGVSDSTLSTIGKPSGVTAPSPVTGSPLTSNGKPVVVYVGGDFCPYCAIERWSIIVALSHFGNFSNLHYMQSSSGDINPNSPTFTFTNSSYTSNYIVFTPIEEFNRASSTTTTLGSYSSLVTSYDTCPGTTQNGGIPFLDIANSWAVNCGAQTNLSISNGNWTQIASQLNDPSSTTAQQIDGAANTLITAICKVLQTSAVGQPSSGVCTHSYADVTIGYVVASGASAQQSVALLPQAREETRWTGSASPF